MWTMEENIFFNLSIHDHKPMRMKPYETLWNDTYPETNFYQNTNLILTIILKISSVL